MRSSTASAPDLLAAYDEQVRRRPVPDGPDDVVEHEGGVVRCVSATGWSGVTYSDLAGRDADAAIAAQLARMPGTWEWKHYSLRRAARPARAAARRGLRGRGGGDADGRRAAHRLDLPRAGACPASRCGRSAPTASPTSWPCTTPSSAATTSTSGDVVRARLERGTAVPGRRLRRRRRRSPPPGSSSSRAPASRGCGATRTLPAHRGRGLFRAIVALRAQLARERGFRYLQVDAMETSRPLFARLGFAELATTTPFIWRAGPTLRGWLS